MQQRLKLSGRSISFETERFRVRSLRSTDASERYLSWVADASIMEPLNMPARQLSLADLKKHIGGFDNRMRFLLGMFDKAENLHFGVFLVDILPVHRLARLQYLIGEEKFRKTGAFRETAAALVTYLFDRRGIEKITAQVNSGNEASAKGLQAIGFRLEGEMKGEIRSFKDGSRIDQQFFGVLKSEWPVEP